MVVTLMKTEQLHSLFSLSADCGLSPRGKIFISSSDSLFYLPCNWWFQRPPETPPDPRKKRETKERVEAAGDEILFLHICSLKPDGIFVSLTTQTHTHTHAHWFLLFKNPDDEFVPDCRSRHWQSPPHPVIISPLLTLLMWNMNFYDLHTNPQPGVTAQGAAAAAAVHSY